MTPEIKEKRRLTNLRQKAVRDAWKEEKELMEQGRCTRPWTKDEQQELRDTGRVKGYYGHHMKSVAKYPEHAGSYKNIQFLTNDEHIQGAHQGSTRNLTNGYYNPKTGEISKFGKGIGKVPLFDLRTGKEIERVKSLEENKKAAKDNTLKAKKTKEEIRENYKRLESGSRKRNEASIKQLTNKRGMKI